MWARVCVCVSSTTSFRLLLFIYKWGVGHSHFVSPLDAVRHECVREEENLTKNKLKRKICHSRMLYEPRPIATLSVDAVSFFFVKTCAFDAIRNRKLNENRKRQRRQSKWIDNPYFMSSICYIVVFVLSRTMALDTGHSNHGLYQCN